MKQINLNNKNRGFKVPDSYFDSIENSFFNKLNKNNPVSIDGFKTPDSYFESIESSVLEKISKPKKSIKIIKLFNKFVPISIAASFILFFGLLIFKDEDTNFNQLDEIDYEYWIDNNIESINSEIIADVYNDITIDDLPNINNIELSDYLEYTNIEDIE